MNATKMRTAASLLAAALALAPAAAMQPAAPAIATAALPGYADLVDAAQTSPLVAAATVRSATRLKPEEAPGLAAGKVRVYVEATVDALIRGAQGIPPAISFLADVPADARGRPPRLKKAAVLILARPVAGRPGEVRLSAPWAMLDRTPETEARLRRIVAELVASSAPPVITGVGNAFHVPGSLPGESETQIFLQTRDARPVSLSVLRRPGETPRWAVALGEMVDEAAGPPRPETLLWYRLACALPPALPETSTAELGPAEAEAARADYAIVIAGLGRCRRRAG